MKKLLFIALLGCFGSFNALSQNVNVQVSTNIQTLPNPYCNTYVNYNPYLTPCNPYNNGYNVNVQTNDPIVSLVRVLLNNK